MENKSHESQRRSQISRWNVIRYRNLYSCTINLVFICRSVHFIWKLIGWRNLTPCVHELYHSAWIQKNLKELKWWLKRIILTMVFNWSDVFFLLFGNQIIHSYFFFKGYNKDLEARFVVVPFKGNRTAMIILLPDKDLAKMINSMTDDLLSIITTTHFYKTSYLEIRIPTFEHKTRIDLTTVSTFDLSFSAFHSFLDFLGFIILTTLFFLSLKIKYNMVFCFWSTCIRRMLCRY